MTKREIDSVEDLVGFVDRAGACSLFKKSWAPRILDHVGGRDSTVRRGTVLRLCEEAHLERRLFLTVDEKGSLLAVSLGMLDEMISQRRALALTADEERLLVGLDKVMSTPELRTASGLPRTRFDRALTGLRSKMRIALVGVNKESKTKHVNCFNRIENWRRTSSK